MTSPLNPDARRADEPGTHEAAGSQEEAFEVMKRGLASPDERRARVLDGLPEAVICVDSTGTITGAWGSCADIFGERPADVVGLNAYERVHPDDIAYAAGALAEAIDRIGEHIPINLRVRSTDGRWVLAEAAAGYLDEPGTLLISLRPLDYRGYLDERRADLQRRCLRIASTVAGAHGDELERAIVTGVLSIHEFFGTVAVRYEVPGEASIDIGGLAAWPSAAATEPGTFVRHPRSGEHSIVEVHAAAPAGARWWLAWAERDPGMAGWDGSHLDDLTLSGAIIASASARQRLEADIEQRSRHDPLTGLANRVELERHLQRTLDRSGATVLFCDLDGYKSVNDRYGHLVGDRVLTAVAGRLNATMRAADLLARVGGDEFVAVCPELSPAGREALVRRLEATLASPIHVDAVVVTIGVSIGTASGPPGSDAAELIAAADVAMYATKASRRFRRPAPTRPI